MQWFAIFGPSPTALKIKRWLLPGNSSLAQSQSPNRKKSVSNVSPIALLKTFPMHTLGQDTPQCADGGTDGNVGWKCWLLEAVKGVMR